MDKKERTRGKRTRGSKAAGGPADAAAPAAAGPGARAANAGSSGSGGRVGRGSAAAGRNRAREDGSDGSRGLFAAAAAADDDAYNEGNFTRQSASSTNESNPATGIDSSMLDVDERELKLTFETFIKTFRVGKIPAEKKSGRRLFTADDEEEGSAVVSDDDDDEDADYDNQLQPFYLHQLQAIFENAVESKDPMIVHSFQIDLQHLKQAARRFLKVLIRRPADVIVFMDEVLATLVDKLYESYRITDSDSTMGRALIVKSHVFNSPIVICMRDLDPKDIDTLVTIRGIIIRCSNILPDMRLAVFICTNRSANGSICGYEEERPLAGGTIDEPLLCTKCQSRYSFELLNARCRFGNKQLVKLQETPDSIPEGETPHTVLAYAYDELLDACMPGDFVQVTGVYRTSGVRLTARMRTLKSVYRVYLDVNSIRRDHLNRYLVAASDMKGDLSEPQSMGESGNPSAEAATKTAGTGNADEAFDDETIEAILSLSKDPDVYNKLVKSLAFNIWEADDVKKGLLCQLFGGTPKYIGGRLSRCDIHILLCGDPSTAKSQLLTYVHQIAPRGIYTCGRGSSAVGLTASVTRDSETKEFVLESGAVLLSDRGICCIDEFDKMDESARVILHEVMEQQTISIAKAGIVCTLNARTAILASANPVNSRYDTRRSVVENINLPSSLMSRFDLIYLMLDSPNKTLDRALAEHLVNLYSVDYATTRKNRPTAPVDRLLFARYISYAKKYCKPKLTEDSKFLLLEAYKELRTRGDKSLGATPRQLESLIRLSEALAKIELSEFVYTKHVEEAIRLIQVATYSALVDPTSGRLDFEQLTEGISSGARRRKELLENYILSCLSSLPNGLDKNSLAEKISENLKSTNENPVDPNSREFNMIIRELEDFGKIGRTAGGRIIGRSG